ncbi:kinase-like domain-containing protein [Mycena sanguinolenta]|nr:kinase-like domain-containing protein [Mycena sanguinolenta]
MKQLNKLFHNHQLYNEFLACRGDPAQQLLDVIQAIMDHYLPVSPVNRHSLLQALLGLSAASMLYPRCFTLAGLQHTNPQVDGGSSGDIYKGQLSGQTVAIKVMRVFEGANIDLSIKEFGQEALIWQQLSHPNILPFYGLYYLEQPVRRICLVSPWMENGHILAFLRRQACETNYRLSLILDVALGLEHIHANGIVHGDLTAYNIFVTRSGRACIADFGSASIIRPLASFQFPSEFERRVASRHQAPELFTEGHNTPYSDVYGFAYTVYEVCSTLPFHRDFEVAGGWYRPSRLPLCSESPSLDALWILLQNCWEERPENRPTASEIIERLIGDDIQATKAQPTTDWDDTFTPRFLRQLLDLWPNTHTG